MATTPMNRVIQHLVAACGRDGMTDGELLTRFLSGRDEDALAALIGRHGPMVWGVCCRVLHNPHDAEDAFQATFLVLVQKAATLPNRETVGNWLHGVAQQTAVRMRALAAKRGLREKQVAVMPEPTTAEQYVWNDLSPVVDEELSRLPNKYRALIVLCDLEGVTRKEVARRLDIPEGTAASRLAAARAMLAKRLARRGIILSGVLLGNVLSQQSAWANVPALVVSNTRTVASLMAAGKAAEVISGPVATLTQGVLKTMFLKKILTSTVAVLALGVAVITCGSLAVGQTEWKPAVGTDVKAPVAEKPMKPAAEQEKEPFTAWGEEVGGLQAGLCISNANDIHIGGKVQGVIKLRNVSKETISVTPVPLWELLSPATVVDSQNKPVRTTSGPYPLLHVGRKKLSLKPGESMDADKTEIPVAGLNQEVKVPDGKVADRQIIHVEPGKYKVQCTGFVQEHSELATGAAEFEVKAAKEAFTAWGMEVGGLQAGLGFKAGEKRVYTHGDTVTLVVRVRNVGKQAVKFEYVKQFLDENRPSVTNASGKPIPQSGTAMLGTHGPTEVSIEPGKEVVLETRMHGSAGSPFALLPESGGISSTKAWPLFVGTGKVSLHYDAVFGNSSSGKIKLDPDLGKLSTGKLELEVTDQPPEGEKKPKAPADPKPEARKVYTPDEIMREKYDPQATLTVEFKVVANAKPTEIKQTNDKDSPWQIGHGPEDVSLLPHPPKKFQEEQFSAILTVKVVAQLKRLGIKDVGKHFDGKTIRISGRVVQHIYFTPGVDTHHDLVIDDLSQIEAVE